MATANTNRERIPTTWDGKRWVNGKRNPVALVITVNIRKIAVQASEHAAGIAYGEHSGWEVAGDDAACADDGVLTDGDAGADDDTAA